MQLYHQLQIYFLITEAQRKVRDNLMENGVCVGKGPEDGSG